jgi:hypothetical protein
VREGLNWIEDGRLVFLPPTSTGESFLDVDGDRVLVAGSGKLEIFRRFGPWHWERRELELPAPPTSFGVLASLSGDWLGVATDAVYLLHREQGEWRIAQSIPIRAPFGLELEGRSLLVRRSLRSTVFREEAGRWDQELDVGTAGGYASDLDGERLAVISNGFLRTYDRVGSSWELSGTFPTTASRVLLAGEHALLDHIPSKELLRRQGSSWVSLGMLQPPAPDLGIFVGVAVSSARVALSSFPSLTENLRGAVLTYALDGARATLRTSATRLALETGGTLALDLDAGPEHAGEGFLLAGSISGSSPGFRVRGLRIPLNRTGDPYYPVSLRRGVLDADGRASVVVVLPPVQPDEPLVFLKDRTLHHVFVTFAAGGGISHVSNVALTAIVARLP